MFESVQGLLDEHDAIQAQLGDPAVYADQRLARKLGRRSAQLNGIVEAYHSGMRIQDDLAAAKEMAAEDPEFAAEVPELEAPWNGGREAAPAADPARSGRCP